LAEKDPSFDEVRKHLRHLVSGEDMNGYAENLIQLLECSPLGFAIEGLGKPSNAAGLKNAKLLTAQIRRS
jgi:hypothetical protein